MAPYSQIRREGNSAHAENCRLHSQRLPPYDPHIEDPELEDDEPIHEALRQLFPDFGT